MEGSASLLVFVAVLAGKVWSAGVTDQHLFDALAEMQQARAYNARRFGPSLYAADCTDAFPRAATIEFTESSAPLPAADTGSHS